MDPTTVCERCGNWYDKPIVIRTHDSSDEHVFDSFECAIDTLAPRCEHCGCRVIGHGIEDEGRIFCCASCARSSVSRAWPTAGIGTTRVGFEIQSPRRRGHWPTVEPDATSPAPDSTSADRKPSRSCFVETILPVAP